jgi:hypothetical protein
MFDMQVKHDPTFPISHHDEPDLYGLYTILKFRGRLETERLDADLEINKKIRDVANLIDMDQRIVDRRTRKPEDHGLR